MHPSVRPGLLALIRQIRSIGHTLKTLILRCLLFWPHFLRSLRRIWSPSSERTGSNPKDIPKNKGGQARPSFPGASGVCEGYSAIYASRNFSRTGEPPSPLGPGNAEPEGLSPSPTIGWPQSAPHNPSTSSLASSLSVSRQRSDRQLSGGSTPSVSSSHNADSVRSRTRQLIIRPVNTPLTLTHSRVTSTQFTGARSRSPSPRLFPTPIKFPSSSLSRSPSPSSPLHTLPLPLSTIQNSSIGMRNSDVVQDASSSEGSRRSSFDIRVSPPSRSQTLELDIHSALNSPRSSVSSQQGYSSGLSQSPTSESEHPIQDPLNRGFHPRYLARNAGHSSGSLPADVLSPSSDRAYYQPSFPQPFNSPVSVQVPIVDSSEIPSDGSIGTRAIRLMHSEQVSRYVKKGDM